MFECKEGRYWATQWFLPIADSVDFLGNLFRDGDGPWQFVYRVAFRDPNDDENTTKNWYAVNLGNVPKEEAAQLVEKLLTESAKASGASPSHMIRTNFDTDNQEEMAKKLIALPHSVITSVNGVPVTEGGKA